MKKLVLPLFLVISSACFSQTAGRNCGTMEYYEMKKKTDPTLQQRMEADEKRIREWIRQQRIAQSPLPKLEGFTPTGDLAVDKVNYAAAKANYAAKNPGFVKSNPIPDQQAYQAAREQKKKSNSFVTTK